MAVQARTPIKALKIYPPGFLRLSCKQPGRQQIYVPVAIKCIKMPITPEPADSVKP